MSNTASKKGDNAGRCGTENRSMLLMLRRYMPEKEDSGPGVDYPHMAAPKSGGLAKR
ncbi:MAG: hypothetical protein ACREBH_03745 [Candidatus Micrarchaeaceae archaeon]